MVAEHHVEGHENFLKLIGNLKVDGPIIVIFSGSNNDKGESWCSDCVEAASDIEKGLKVAPESTQIVHVQVGNREYWKDNKCPFRSKPTNLKVLPTLLRWGTAARLEGDDCQKADLIKMMFDDDAL